MYLQFTIFTFTNRRIFTERDKSVFFNVVVLNNVYMYYTIHVSELNGGYEAKLFKKYLR